MRKNRKEIPTIFLTTRQRELGTAIYVLTKNITFTHNTHAQKFLKKSVVLVSSYHHQVSEEPVTKKSDIIMNYNSTKSGVDSIDKKFTKFTSSRRTRR